MKIFLIIRNNLQVTIKELRRINHNLILKSLNNIKVSRKNKARLVNRIKENNKLNKKKMIMIKLYVFNPMIKISIDNQIKNSKLIPINNQSKKNQLSKYHQLALQNIII